jgi:hypothetical protein
MDEAKPVIGDRASDLRDIDPIAEMLDSDLGKLRSIAHEPIADAIEVGGERKDAIAARIRITEAA